MPESPDLCCTLDTSDSMLNWTPFHRLNSIAELSKVARTIESKSSIMDPLPAVLPKEHFDMLLPTLKTNCDFETAIPHYIDG